MPTLTHIHSQALTWANWKNNGGRTQELAIWPPGVELNGPDLGWRLARAECARPGPFSSFPGFDRFVLPLDGDLCLSLGVHSKSRRVRRGECAGFAGDWPTSVELPNGPVHDLNLLCARGAWTGTLTWLSLGRRRVLEELERGHLVLHLVEGRLRVRVTGEEEPLLILPSDSLWLRDARAGDVLECTGLHDDTNLVVARVQPTPGART